MSAPPAAHLDWPPGSEQFDTAIMRSGDDGLPEPPPLLERKDLRYQPNAGVIGSGDEPFPDRLFPAGRGRA
jgi:hypothetical protein